MSEKILITPRSFKNFKNIAYPLIEAKGYEIIENSTGKTYTETELAALDTRDIAGIIVGVDPLPARILEQFKQLRAISKYGVGMDNIDLDKARELGIKVRNAAGTNNISVAEAAIALMFSITRHIYPSVYNVKNGGWDRVVGYELTGKRLGLVGCGQIGREVAKRACGLEMRVTLYDPYFNDDEFLQKYNIERTSVLKEVFASSDIVSLHIPATPETKGIVNAEMLSCMKSSAFLINTARGELVDEAALYEALRNHTIAGAAQDVFSCEPPKPGECLLQMDNFILTPHIGALTREAVERMVVVSTQNLLEMLELKGE